jgi:hypothetical protein
MRPTDGGGDGGEGRSIHRWHFTREGGAHRWGEKMVVATSISRESDGAPVTGLDKR